MQVCATNWKYDAPAGPLRSFKRCTASASKPCDPSKGFLANPACEAVGSGWVVAGDHYRVCNTDWTAGAASGGYSFCSTPWICGKNPFGSNECRRNDIFRIGNACVCTAGTCNEATGLCSARRRLLA